MAGMHCGAVLSTAPTYVSDRPCTDIRGWQLSGTEFRPTGITSAESRRSISREAGQQQGVRLGRLHPGAALCAWHGLAIQDANDVTVSTPTEPRNTNRRPNASASAPCQSAMKALASKVRSWPEASGRLIVRRPPFGAHALSSARHQSQTTGDARCMPARGRTPADGGGQLVGAIGVSGMQSTQDAQVAAVGAKAMADAG